MTRGERSTSTGTRGDAPLWAITCYFNPARFRRRLENYREFRRRLAAPLVTVELAFDGPFELADDAAEIVIRVTGGSVLWQKERLLNLAWPHVPPACRKIAWLDCDVFFEADDWVDGAAALLEDHALIVPFTRVAELRRGASLGSAPSLAECDVGVSLVDRWNRGERPDGILSSNVRLARTHSGLAWAARRETVDGLGLYDACVLGSGNRAMLCAAIGRPDDAIRYLCMGPAWAEHYRAWASRYHARVGGRIGSLPTTIFHLWHGEIEARRYAERHRDLARYGFAPATDVAAADGGPWVWASDKPDMHAFVRRYFDARREDG